MRKWLCPLLLLATAIAVRVPIAGEQAAAPYNPSAYPKLSQQVEFFAERLTSPNDRTRYQLLHTVRLVLPLPEAERLLREMMQDPDDAVSDQALMGLLSFGYPIPKEQLPQRVAGIDRKGPEELAEMLVSLRESIERPAEDAPFPGHAAQKLGLLGGPEDIPKLRALDQSPNIYVRFSAAVALINLGDKQTGKEILASIADSPLEPTNYYYIRQSLLTLHHLGVPGCLEQLVEHIAVLEKSEEPNAQNHYTHGLMALARLTGEWHDDAAAWREYFSRGAE